MMIENTFKGARYPELERPEVYYATRLNGALGASAVEQFINDGGDEADLSPLDDAEIGEFLREGGDILYKIRWSLRFQGWDNQQILEAVKWLYSILPPPSRPKQKHLTEKVIDSASYLDLVPSVRQITYPNRFRSSSNLFRALGKVSANIRYHELSTREAMDYIKSVRDQIGKMPSERYLNELFAANPNNYSYDVLSERLPGGLKRAARELGYVVAEDEADYLTWGVDFYVANNGLAVSQDIMTFASEEGKSPGYSNTKRRWALDEFKGEVEQKVYAMHEEIVEQVKSGRLPAGLIPQNASLSTIFLRYMRYRTVADLLPSFTSRACERLAKADIPDSKFLETLTAYRAAIDWDLLDRAAKEYGVLRNMWRKDYIASLSLEAIMKHKIERLHGPLSDEDRYVFDDSIEIAADFLMANDLQFLSRPAVRLLQKHKHLPKQEQMHALFISHTYFSMLVRQRLKNKKQQYERERAAAQEILEERLSGERYRVISRKELDTSTGKRLVAMQMFLQDIIPNLQESDLTEYMAASSSRSFLTLVIDRTGKKRADLELLLQESGLAFFIDDSQENHRDEMRRLYQRYRRSQLNRNYRSRQARSRKP